MTEIRCATTTCRCIYHLSVYSNSLPLNVTNSSDATGHFGQFLRCLRKIRTCCISLANPVLDFTQGCIYQIFTGGGSEFWLAMTDGATIAGMEVAKLVLWNSLLNQITSRRKRRIVVHNYTGLARKWNGWFRGVWGDPPKRFCRTFWGQLLFAGG